MTPLTADPPLTEEELGRINPRIRLSPREQLAMREVFARELPATATVYLFGSRTDLNAAGGDIDLLIHVPGIGFEEELALSTRLNDALIARLGERKIDLVFTPVADATAKPFVRLALTRAVSLHP
jgi:predicted nucleotidyltransferase